MNMDRQLKGEPFSCSRFRHLPPQGHACLSRAAILHEGEDDEVYIMNNSMNNS
jgi:hypothetical protein